jgi:hypothetical protein
MAIPQSYPRDEKGFLDVAKYPPHQKKIVKTALKVIIKEAIVWAGKKSSRAILEIPDETSADERVKVYRKKGKELFAYFRKYYGDPATSAYEAMGKHFSDVAKDQFRNQTLQKERMNSGWRYQYIAKDCAISSKRFKTVSDIGAAEADFNATIRRVDTDETLNIYVSIKNRSNTMGGQDWPKAIYALEDVARTDKNRAGPYLCIFGIVIEKGQRTIRKNGKTKNPYSVNTEVWASDFFWPFFSNFSYSEIAKAVLEVLMEEGKKIKLVETVYMPDELIEAFGAECNKFGLLDSDGKFNDPIKLIDLFCYTNGNEGKKSNNPGGQSRGLKKSKPRS